ncbi:MAG: sugar ABC transporter permease [Gorillibacterium sp.]|nr:sugar ABC transporter permease [Gorillibacterium sp.]
MKSGTSVQAGLRQARYPSLWKRLLSQWEYQVMVLPAILFIVVFSYIPMWGVLMAFQDYDMFKGFWASEWVGLKHFRMFFSAPEFWQIIRNTIMISMGKLVIGFPAPIILALMLNEVRSMVYKRVIQTISYLPHFISWVIMSGILFSLLSVDTGSINLLLQKIGLIDEPINWLSNSHYFWGLLITANVWKEVGFGAIVYLAAIAGVDPHLYEAASIDGANRFKQIFLITLPSITPVILIFLILQISNILNAGFEDILLLTNNGNNAIIRNVSEVIDTYVYRTGILNQRYSYAIAAGLFKSLVNILMLILANGLSRRFGKSSLW